MVVSPKHPIKNGCLEYQAVMHYGGCGFCCGSLARLGVEICFINLYLCHGVHGLLLRKNSDVYI